MDVLLLVEAMFQVTAVPCSWSTSAFDIGSGPSGIISPEDRRITPFTLEHTIALPYFIEGTMCDDDRRKYENECLEHLHIMCLYNKVLKKKVTCSLMEITLASNGSTVSDRALTYWVTLLVYTTSVLWSMRL